MSRSKRLSEEFVRYFKWILISRGEFEFLKRVSPDTLTDIQWAARFYYLQQMFLGGRMDEHPAFGYAAVRGSKLNLLRIEEQLSAAHLRLARVYLECLPYHETLKRYDKPGTIFYLAPPYRDCEDYYCDMRLKFPLRRSVVRLGAISRAALLAKPPLWIWNFIPNPQYGKGVFCKDDFTILAEMLGKIQGKFIRLSLNDRPEVREIFSNHMEEAKVNYTCSNGKNLKAGELIFRNFD